MKSIYSLFVRGYQVNPTETDRKGLTELSEIKYTVNHEYRLIL